MKIIAVVKASRYGDATFLVEATQAELCAAAGVSSYNVQKITGRKDNDQMQIGDIIAPTLAYEWHTRVRDQEKKCRDSAAFLRGMADMMDAALPTTVIPADVVKED